MAYTKDDYIKDMYIVDNSHDVVEKGDARRRIEWYESGRTNLIESQYPEYSDESQISDYEISIWGCLAVLTAAEEAVSPNENKHEFIRFMMERYNGLDDFDENERPLIRQIHNEAANGFHIEKAMYSGSGNNFLKLKESRDSVVNNLIPLMKQYKEQYYDKKQSKVESGSDSGIGCLIALVVIAIMLVLFIRSCMG